MFKILEKFLANFDYNAAHKGALSFRHTPKISQQFWTAVKRASNSPETAAKYRLKGRGASAVYTAERQELHNTIITKLLRPALSQKCRPADGKTPTLIMLGGISGAGKSKFKDVVYPATGFAILNADLIKKGLPEYADGNAVAVHHESVDILDKAIQICARHKLNAILDVTMNNFEHTLARLNTFKKQGYQTEAHYMICSSQKAILQSASRFAEDGRCVPPDIILNMRNTQANFLKIRQLTDAYTVYSNTNFSRREPVLLEKRGLTYRDKHPKQFPKSTYEKPEINTLLFRDICR